MAAKSRLVTPMRRGYHIRCLGDVYQVFYHIRCLGDVYQVFAGRFRPSSSPRFTSRDYETCQRWIDSH